VAVVLIKYIVALGLGATAAQAEPALPPKADMRALNCASVFEMNRSSTVMVLAWLQARYQAKDAPPVLDSEKLMADAVKLNGYCTANPGKTMRDAADALFEGKF
jgi:hypothetical protein